MQRLLLISLLFTCLLLVSCKNQGREGNKSKLLKVDSTHIHNAPNQARIDSIKSAKTKAKVKRESNR